MWTVSNVGGEWKQLRAMRLSLWTVEADAVSSFKTQPTEAFKNVYNDMLRKHTS